MFDLKNFWKTSSPQKFLSQEEFNLKSYLNAIKILDLKTFEK